MGANGSYAKGSTNDESGRRWKTIAVLKDGTKVIELKAKGPVKLPEESHTPNSVYAIFSKDGSGVKAIAKYGDDGKKLYEGLPVYGAVEGIGGIHRRPCAERV